MVTQATSEAAEAARREVEELGGLLRAAIRGSGSTAKAVSLRLGHGAAYLTRVFKGNYPLKVRHVFEVLAALGEHPGVFFARRYPLGPPLPPLPPAPPRPKEPKDLAEDLPGELSEEAMMAEGERQFPTPAPAELVEKTARLLAAVLERKGVKRRTVDRALKLGTDDRLGRALRGESELLAYHLFGSLAVAGVTPPRFFAELLTPAERSYTEIWDLLEELLKRAMPRLREKKPPRDGETPRRAPRRRRASKSPPDAETATGETPPRAPRRRRASKPPPDAASEPDRTPPPRPRGRRARRPRPDAERDADVERGTAHGEGPPTE